MKLFRVVPPSYITILIGPIPIAYKIENHSDRHNRLRNYNSSYNLGAPPGRVWIDGYFTFFGVCGFPDAAATSLGPFRVNSA